MFRSMTRHPPLFCRTRALRRMLPALLVMVATSFFLISPPLSKLRSAVSPVASNLAPAERFIATNRFRVRNAAGFEKRWAERKSRLGTLDGFRYFTLLRRIDGPAFFKDSRPGKDDAPDYISCTLWESEDEYTAWRKGDAFKEAHGGSGGIAAFASMLKTAIFLLKGKPSPALYEATAVCTAATPSPTVDAEGGWRQDIRADGQSLLEPESFAVVNRWPVREGREADFEAKMEASRTNRDTGPPPGLKVRTLMRRAGLRVDDGFMHSTLSVWDSEASFSAWRASVPRADAIREMMADGIISGPPSPLFFEGLLCLESIAGP